MSKREFRKDTYCGLYCGACDSLVATRDGWVGEIAAAEGISIERASCGGCKSDFTCNGCTTCEFLTCCRSRGYETCADCPEMPCELLLNFRNDDRPHHSVVIHNLERIREIGVPAWLDEQEKRWACPACGAPVLWYMDHCRNCGAPVEDSHKEDRELSR